MRKLLSGQFYKNASHRNSYEIFDAEADFVDNLYPILDRFGFSPKSEPVVGLDQIFIDFSNGKVDLVLGWDNWSGCFVYACEPEGDGYVFEIGSYLDTVLNDL